MKAYKKPDEPHTKACKTIFWKELLQVLGYHDLAATILKRTHLLNGPFFTLKTFPLALFARLYRSNQKGQKPLYLFPLCRSPTVVLLL